MRLFAAIRLPKEIRSSLRNYAETLKQDGLYLVNEENIHITLKFYGEGDPEEIAKELEKIEFEGFEMTVRGIGVFPNKKYVRVVWAGAYGAEELAGKIGNDEYVGHATLARAKKKVEIETSDREFGRFMVEKFELVESRLGPHGPKYVTVREFGD